MVSPVYKVLELLASNVIVHGIGPPDPPERGPYPNDSKWIAPVSVPSQAGTYCLRLVMLGPS